MAVLLRFVTILCLFMVVWVFCCHFGSLWSRLASFCGCFACLSVTSSVGPVSNLSMDVNHQELLCGLGSSENEIVPDWFLTWPYLCCVADDEMTWNMRDKRKKMEIWRDKEKMRKENKTKTGDTEIGRDNKEDVIPASLLQHPFSLYCLIFSFLLFALPLIFSFYYSSSLFLSLSLVFISVSLAFCCSDTQSNEPWNIRYQDTETFCVCACVVCECVYVCAGGRLCTCMCVHTHFDFGFEVCRVY